MHEEVSKLSPWLSSPLGLFRAAEPDALAWATLGDVTEFFTVHP